MKDDNPDKGTETYEDKLDGFKDELKDDNPDKGTETGKLTSFMSSLMSELKDDNPDKGTETIKVAYCISIYIIVER